MRLVMQMTVLVVVLGSVAVAQNPPYMVWRDTSYEAGRRWSGEGFQVYCGGDVILDPQHRIFVIGSKWDEANAIDSAIIIRYSPNGHPERHHTLVAYPGAPWTYTIWRRAIQDATGYVYLAGDATGGPNSVAVAMYETRGDILDTLWFRVFGNGSAQAIDIDAAGNIYVGYYNTGGQARLIKCDNDGDLIYDAVIGTNHWWPIDIAVDPNGDVFFAASGQTANGKVYKISGTSTNGGIIWQQDANDQNLRKIIVDNNGHSYEVSSKYGVYVVKRNGGNGVPIWARSPGGTMYTGWDLGFDSEAAPTFLCLSSDGYPSKCRISSWTLGGDLRWDEEYALPGTNSGSQQGKMDIRNGFVYGLYTWCLASNSQWRFTTVKRRGDDGGLIWATTYAESDCSYGLMVKADYWDRAIVTGSHWNFSVGPRILALCYSDAPLSVAASTEPSSGRHLMRELGTATNYHFVCHDYGNNVYHVATTDAGGHWLPPDFIDQGQYPSIGLGDYVGFDGPPVCVAYKNVGELRYRYRVAATGAWQGFTVFPPFGAFMCCSGPPSLYVNGPSVYVVYPVENGVPLGWAYGIFFNEFGWGATGPGPYEIVATSYSPLTLPCITQDASGILHVVFEENGRLRYKYRDPFIGGWLDGPQIPYPTGGLASYQPFIETYAEYLHVPWAETLGGPNERSDIYWAWRSSNQPSWIGPIEILRDPYNSSASPVCAQGDIYTFVDYDAGTSTLDPRYWRTTGSNGWILNTPYRSYWPHSDIYYSPFGWQTTLSTLWTENNAPHYFVCFNRADVTYDKGGERIYYAVECGQEKQSPFCQFRAGFLRVNNYSVDYGDSLVYNLTYLDPRYDYVARIAAVHGGTTAWDARVVVDDQAFGTIRVPPAKLESLVIKLPQAAYAKDRAIRLVLKKETGTYAPCQNIRLVRYERPRKGQASGGQSASVSPLTSQMSMNVHPTLVRDRMTVTFQLAAACNVNLSLHDVTGRRIMGLCDRQFTAGKHVFNLNADGLPNGVYFLQLETNEQRQTKKLLLVR